MNNPLDWLYFPFFSCYVSVCRLHNVQLWAKNTPKVLGAFVGCDEPSLEVRKLFSLSCSLDMQMSDMLQELVCANIHS